MSVKVIQTHVAIKQTQNKAVIKRVVGGPQGPAGQPSASLADGTVTTQMLYWDNSVTMWKPTDEADLAWNPTTSILTTNAVQWKTSPTIAADAEGLMYWDGANNTMSVGMTGGNVVLQVGQEGLVYVRNISGAQIDNGKLVYVTGVQGNRLTIDLADNTDSSTIHILGMVTEDIGHNSNGYVTLWGRVRSLNTDPVTYTDGETLYLGTTGDFTNTHPPNPTDAVIEIGFVAKAHLNQGEVELHPTPFTLTASYDGIARQSVVNTNTGTSSAAGFTTINDAGHRSTFGIGGQNHTAFADVGVVYTEGYGDLWIAVDGNKDIVFYTDPTDSHNNSALSYPRFTIKADGTLRAGATNYETLVLLDDDIPNKKYVDDEIDAKIDDGTATGQIAWWNGTKWTYTETNEMLWDDSQQGLKIQSFYGLRNTAQALNIQYNATYDVTFHAGAATGTTPAVILGGTPPLSATNKIEFRCVANGIYGLNNNANVTTLQSDLNWSLKADNLKYYMGAANDAYLTWTGTTLDISTSSLTINSAYTIPVADGTTNYAMVTNGLGAVTFTQLDHTVHLSNVGTNTHAQIDTHIADATIHFTEASIDHTAITNIGTNTHAQIDTHIADATIHFTEASIDHTAITNIGTNTHAQIDTHIAATSNPHTVTLEQARTAGATYSGNVNYGNNSITNIAGLASASAALNVNADAAQDVSFFASATNNETPGVNYYGFPDTATLQRVKFYHSADGIFLFNATTDVQHFAFDTDVVLPKTSGYGIKVDTATPTFGWRDIVGQLHDKTGGVSGPSWTTYRGTIDDWAFPNTGVEKEMFVSFHMPHDYVPGSDLYLHVHWSQNVVDTGGAASAPGSVQWDFDVSYSDGHGTPGGAADPFIAPITTTVTQQGSTTQYGHMIAELQLSDPSPSASQLDSDTLEVDGLLLVRLYRDSDNDTLNQVPFVHFVDIHYQSTNMATKQKAPDFYT